MWTSSLEPTTPVNFVSALLPKRTNGWFYFDSSADRLFLFCSTTGRLTATSPATPRSSDPKVSFRLRTGVCSISADRVRVRKCSVCLWFRREHRRSWRLRVRRSCQRSPCSRFHGNRFQARGGEKSPRAGASEGWEISGAKIEKPSYVRRRNARRGAKGRKETTT